MASDRESSALISGRESSERGCRDASLAAPRLRQVAAAPGDGPAADGGVGPGEAAAPAAGAAPAVPACISLGDRNDSSLGLELYRFLRDFCQIA